MAIKVIEAAIHCDVAGGNRAHTDAVTFQYENWGPFVAAGFDLWHVDLAFTRVDHEHH